MWVGTGALALPVATGMVVAWGSAELNNPFSRFLSKQRGG